MPSRFQCQDMVPNCSLQHRARPGWTLTVPEPEPEFWKEGFGIPEPETVLETMIPVPAKPEPEFFILSPVSPEPEFNVKPEFRPESEIEIGLVGDEL